MGKLVGIWPCHPDSRIIGPHEPNILCHDEISPGSNPAAGRKTIVYSRVQSPTGKVGHIGATVEQFNPGVRRLCGWGCGGELGVGTDFNAERHVSSDGIRCKLMHLHGKQVCSNHQIGHRYDVWTSERGCCHPGARESRIPDLPGGHVLPQDLGAVQIVNSTVIHDRAQSQLGSNRIA